tara:strand:+ start:1537 stop:1827 length:291 start_codon:yes stop_codon:yes gene_type:complete
MKKKKNLFSESIHIMITPWDKGFTCAIVGDNKQNMTPEEYELCNTIARGLIKASMDNPHKIYTLGVEGFAEDKKDKSSNVVDFLDFVKSRASRSFH